MCKLCLGLLGDRVYYSPSYINMSHFHPQVIYKGFKKDVTEDIERLNQFYFALKWIWKNNLMFFMLIMSVLLVSVIGYIFYLQPLLINKKFVYLKINSLNVQLAEKQKSLSKYVVNTEKLVSLKCQFFLCSGNVEKYNKNVTLLALISGQMLPETLAINYLRSGISQDRTVFVELPIEVTIAGNKKNIEAFLYQIANLRYPVLLNKFKWNFFDFINAESEGKLTILFVLYLEDAASKTIFSIPAHDGVSSIKYLDKEILTQYALSEIKMVGFLSDFFKKVWALIQLPDNQFRKVELNDKLGLEKGRIILIDTKKIVIQEENNNKSIEISIESKDL